SAETALKLADGNLDRALDMDAYVDKKYIIIQGKFSYGGYHKYYGLFIFIADGKDGEVIKTDIIISSEAEDTNISLEVDSKVFIKTINELDNNKSQQASQLRLLLNDTFNPAKLFEILDMAKENDISGINQIIKIKLEEELEEKVDLRLRAKIKTEVQLRKMHPEFFSTEEEETEDEENEDSKLGINITLNCIPIVSPTFGEKITNLDIGSQLLVKVVDQREVGQYLDKLLSSDVGAVAGTIEGIEYKEKSQRYSVLIRLSSNVYGKIYVESEIKLATPESEQQKMEKLNNLQKKEQEDFMDQDLTTLLLLVGLIIVLLVIMMKLYI
ncbi:MAG: hypothetical protein ACQERJ_02820, partial [Bacillota bacterium]